MSKGGSGVEAAAQAAGVQLGHAALRILGLGTGTGGRACGGRLVGASISSRRACWFPALVIDPRLRDSPEDDSAGTRPT